MKAGTFQFLCKSCGDRVEISGGKCRQCLAAFALHAKRAADVEQSDREYIAQRQARTVQS